MKFGMDPTPGLAAADVAKAYVGAVEGVQQGKIIDPGQVSGIAHFAHALWRPGPVGYLYSPQSAIGCEVSWHRPWGRNGIYRQSDHQRAVR